jgi:hypothetical protein
MVGVEVFVDTPKQRFPPEVRRFFRECRLDRSVRLDIMLNIL